MALELAFEATVITMLIFFGLAWLFNRVGQRKR